MRSAHPQHPYPHACRHRAASGAGAAKNPPTERSNWVTSQASSYLRVRTSGGGEFLESSSGQLRTSRNKIITAHCGCLQRMELQDTAANAHQRELLFQGEPRRARPSRRGDGVTGRGALAVLRALRRDHVPIGLWGRVVQRLLQSPASRAGPGGAAARAWLAAAAATVCDVTEGRSPGPCPLGVGSPRVTDEDPAARVAPGRKARPPASPGHARADADTGGRRGHAHPETRGPDARAGAGVARVPPRRSRRCSAHRGASEPTDVSPGRAGPAAPGLGAVGSSPAPREWEPVLRATWSAGGARARGRGANARVHR